MWFSKQKKIAKHCRHLTTISILTMHVEFAMLQLLCVYVDAEAVEKSAAQFVQEMQTFAASIKEMAPTRV